MRQRTINDFFWRNPEMSELSQEDKSTLLYLLTSPASNIIGVYQVVWRIAAAEMGWTADQLLTVVTRLRSLELVEIHEQGFVWVKIWWKHNSVTGAFSPKLFAKAKKECDAMPSEWLNGFLDLVEEAGKDRVSIGYPYPIDRVPTNTNTNTNTNANSVSTNAISHCHDCDSRVNLTSIEPIKESKRLEQSASLMAQINSVTLILPKQFTVKESEHAFKLLGSFSREIAQQILDELAGRLHSNSVRGSPLSYLRALVVRAKTGTFTPEAGIRVALARKRDEEVATTTKINSQAEIPVISTNASVHLDALRKIISGPENGKSNEC